jgi:hypothetical protein
MIESPTMETFSRLANTKFLMHFGESQSAELELVKVADVGSSARQIQFSLLFVGRNAPLSQGIYRVEHDELGTLDLFLVPIGRDQNGIQYEAIFNRMVS